MKKIVIMLVSLSFVCSMAACSCKDESVISPSDVSSTEIVSQTETEKEDEALTVEEILSFEGNIEILESVGITEIKESVMERAIPGPGGRYLIRIVDINDNVYYVFCNEGGGIDEICKDSPDGELLFYVLP